jgi:hypothetical protein
LLEAELDASRKAFDAATAAKVNAEKSTKSALAKVKKAEKALSDANKEHLQREQVVAERLNKMSAVAGGIYYTFLFVDLPTLLCLLIYSISTIFVSLVLQNILRCLRQICNQTTILSWPQLACWKRTRYLSRKSSS